MKLEEKQKVLDEVKWLKSEQEGRDVCGEFDYCKHCDKAKAHPCASALAKAEKALKKPATKKVAETSKTATKKTATKKASIKKTTKAK